MKKGALRLSALVSFLFFSFFLTGSVWAQAKGGEAVSKPLLMIVALSAMALLPILLIMVTSFIKITVVFSLLRSALGTQQIPPNQVITGLAIILTIYIMAPVGMQCYRNAEGVINQASTQGFFSQTTIDMAKEGFEKAKEPIRAFLDKHASKENTDLFLDLSRKIHKPDSGLELSKDHFLILIPAFVVSELSKAFQIGFIIFLPFLVIDMVVANILLSLGMFQLSPITVSLPFKLLLFVISKGWYLIAKGLVLGYA